MKDKIQAISIKIDNLMGRNAQLSSEIQNLKSENQKFQLLLEEKNSKMEELNVQILEVKKQSTSNQGFDVENYKNKLNGMMKEIDECIAILNN